MDIWGNTVKDRGSSKCKGLEESIRLELSRNNKETSDMN